MTAHPTSAPGYRLVFGALGSLTALFTASYLVALASGVQAVEQWRLDDASWAAVAIAALLLVGDGLIPVPSSLVMVALGAALPLPIAFAVAFGARVAMSLGCYAVGRLARGPAARLVTSEENAAARRVFDRFGVYAVLLTRPLPMVGESVLVLSGLTRLPFHKVLLAGGLASAAEAASYVLLGHLAGEFLAVAALWLVLLVVAGAIAWFGIRRSADASQRPAGTVTN